MASEKLAKNYYDPAHAFLVDPDLPSATFDVKHPWNRYFHVLWPLRFGLLSQYVECVPVCARALVCLS